MYRPMSPAPARAREGLLRTTEMMADPYTPPRKIDKAWRGYPANYPAWQFFVITLWRLPVTLSELMALDCRPASC